ncbi:MAG: hypothetical protein FWC50_04055 [Planctomycetaceae bacterium]|nr:hypothetical protein [Planctomycetaceae bacterium]
MTGIPKTARITPVRWVNKVGSTDIFRRRRVFSGKTKGKWNYPTKGTKRQLIAVAKNDTFYEE